MTSPPTAPTGRNIILIAHNLRSCHNIGSLFRTCEGLGVTELILTGYTPYPTALPAVDAADLISGPRDQRLPHLANKMNTAIHKTALGAETMVPWRHHENIFAVLDELRGGGWQIIAVEQNASSIALPQFQSPLRTALIVGREVEGIEPEVLAAVDQTIEIPMLGHKESFNVVQAAAMTLYHCRYITP